MTLKFFVTKNNCQARGWEIIMNKQCVPIKTSNVKLSAYRLHWMILCHDIYACVLMSSPRNLWVVYQTYVSWDGIGWRFDLLLLVFVPWKGNYPLKLMETTVFDEFFANIEGLYGLLSITCSIKFSRHKKARFFDGYNYKQSWQILLKKGVCETNTRIQSINLI